MRRLLVALGTLTVLVLGSGPALADPPVEVSDQVTDPGGVLGAQSAQVRSSLDRLHTEDGIDLYVVLVSGFDTPADTDWATETASLSELEGSDMLLAIDVAGGGYTWWVDDDFPVSTPDLDDLFVSRVEPLVVSGAWADAVIATTDGLSAESGAFLGGSSVIEPWSGTTTAVVGAVVLVTLGVAHVLSRRKTSAAAG
jgi:hypothetical protein